MAITKISTLFKKDRIALISATGKNQIIDQLVQLSNDKITDIDKFKQSIFAREAIVSTGIGQGFAIPHVKNEYSKHFFITMAIVTEGVDWDAIDNNPVYIVFMIGGPDGKQNEYLSILSKLSLIIKNPKNKEKILNASSTEEVFQFFEKY